MLLIALDTLKKNVVGSEMLFADIVNDFKTEYHQCNFKLTCSSHKISSSEKCTPESCKSSKGNTECIIVNRLLLPNKGLISEVDMRK